MHVSKNSENRIIGDLVSQEKYTWADKALIAMVVRDTVEKINAEDENNIRRQ